MSDRTAYVYVDLDGRPVLVGTLYARFRKNRESATFTYDASWLSQPSRFALEPALVLHDLAHHTQVARRCSARSATPHRIVGAAC
jgi:serine/threonine-protein kinase HipA